MCLPLNYNMEFLMSKEELEHITRAVEEIQSTIEDIQERLKVLQKRSEELFYETREPQKLLPMQDHVYDGGLPDEHV